MVNLNFFLFFIFFLFFFHFNIFSKESLFTKKEIEKVGTPKDNRLPKKEVVETWTPERVKDWVFKFFKSCQFVNAVVHAEHFNMSGSEFLKLNTEEMKKRYPGLPSFLIQTLANRISEGFLIFSWDLSYCSFLFSSNFPQFTKILNFP